MKEFGLQLYSIRDQFTDAESTRNAFKKMAEFGYSYCQTAGTYDYISPELFRQYADEAGIRIVGTHFSNTRMVTDIPGTIQYHRTLGTDEIGTGGWGVSNLEELKQMIETWNRIGRIYAAEGFHLAYHNHSEEFSNEFKKYEGKTRYDYLLEGLDPAFTKFTLDAGWAHLAGVDVRDLMETRLKGKMNIVHIKDIEADVVFPFPDPEPAENGNPYRGPQRIEIGRGNMNFKGIIKTAEACGAKYFVVEDEMYSTGVPLESVKMSADYIKANLVER